jgi:hypothetical protein
MKTMWPLAHLLLHRSMLSRERRLASIRCDEAAGNGYGHPCAGSLLMTRNTEYWSLETLTAERLLQVDSAVGRHAFTEVAS